MREITLPGTEIRTTALGFGCGGLMRTASRRQRLALLQEAYDSGIRHFDVARMYGLGVAEAELGGFLKGRRDGVVVATKFGIEVATRHKAVVAMQGLARRIIALSPGLKKLARRKSGAMYQPRKYDVETAKKSLHTSLRELGTDYLDIYFLHEPTLADIADSPIVEYLEKAREDGLIRAYGVAGYPDTLLPIANELPGLMKVVQVPNDVVNRQLKLFDLPGSATITFSPYSTALDVITGHLSAGKDVAKRWSEATGCDMTDADNVAGYLLRYCLNDNANGVVLFSSARKQRISAAAKIASEVQGRPELLRAFTELVDKDILAASAGSRN